MFAVMHERSACLALLATAMVAAPAPLLAQVDQTDEIRGRCQYSDRVARYRHETALILCDTASIGREGGSATLHFRQRSWGSMAQFSGTMSGSRMSVARAVLRDGRAVAASGTCEIFYHDNGHISAISCLVRAGTRSVAANFVPSRL